jgi:hypothetical protein
MERLSYSVRCALVVELIKRLRSEGSWCGETHLQKATFIIQDLTKSNLGYKFVLYKHGPYSFEFNSELNSMRAAGVLEFQFPREGYGPSIAPTTFGERIREANEENVRAYIPIVSYIANWFAAKDVRYLEKIATAYYVTKNNPRDPAFERAKRLNSLKPHVDIDSAEEAVRVVDEKRQQAKIQWGQIAA